jgi:hypothetical protein
LYSAAISLKSFTCASFADHVVIRSFTLSSPDSPESPPPQAARVISAAKAAAVNRTFMVLNSSQ